MKFIYYPTKEVAGDCFSSPVQGVLFVTHRDTILGIIKTTCRYIDISMAHILQHAVILTQHEHLGQKECVVRKSYCELVYVLYILAIFIWTYENNVTV